MQKLLVPLLAVIANLIFVWFGKKGADAEPVFHTVKYFWLLLIANIIFAYTAKIGVASFESFFTFNLVWIASAPVAALIFNWFVGKESVSLINLFGVVLIFAGSILVSLKK